MIKVADAVPGDETAIAALCTGLEEYYGDLPEGLPAERAAQVRDVLFGDPPVARALIAWDDRAPAGFRDRAAGWIALEFPAGGAAGGIALEFPVGEASTTARDGQPASRPGQVRAGRGSGRAGSPSRLTALCGLAAQ